MAVGSSSATKVNLTPEVLSNFKIAKVFRTHNEGKRPLTSLCYDDKGEFLVTTGQDETIQLFHAVKGKHVKQAFSKKYGCNLARFTHKSSAIVHASTKEDDTIRYLSLHDNTYIRYFKGHKRKVTSLEMSPRDDVVLSGSTDDTVRLWDLRSPNCQGLLNIAGQPCVAFDPAGMVFAVALNMRQTIMLYDLKQFDSEPFLAKHIHDQTLKRAGFPPPVFTSLKFSNDGKKLLIGTAGNVHYVVDAFSGDLVARLEGHQGLEVLDPTYSTSTVPVAGASGEEVSWTPDGRFVFSGGADGKITLWDVQPPPSDPVHATRQPGGPDTTWRPAKQFDGHLGGACRSVSFNPRFGMMATADDELAFWLPDKGQEAEA